MTIADLADLVAARSAVTIRTDAYSYMAGLETSVEGLDEEHILRALPEWMSAFIADTVEADRVKLVYAGFPSGAVTLTDAPGWMYLHASDFFQITPDPAVATLGKMSIAAASGASTSTISAGALIVRWGSGTTQQLYTNTEPFTPIVGTPVVVPMVAQVAGAGGNIGNNAVLSLVTAYPGLSVTNPPISGTQSWITRRGRNAETLVSIKSRCDGRWAELSYDVPSERFAKIIRDAYIAAGETPVITRIYVDDANPLGPGSVAVYMATDSGAATADDVALVDAYVIPRWRAGGGPFKSYAAATYTISLSITIKGPSNAALATTQVSAALSALATTYRIDSARVYKQQVESAIFGGVTGALNVITSLPEETSIPAGSIVAFSVSTLTVVP